MSYNLAKSIIGNEIIGSCVKHDLVNSEDNILKRPIRIRLKNRSHGRTGRWSEAFVNTEIKKIEESETYYTTDTEKEIARKLKEVYKVDFDVQRKGSIKGNHLIGECSELGKISIIPKFSASHQGQRVPMKCKEFALSYVDLFFETTYTKI